MYRAAIGDYVRNRLLRTPNAFRMPAREADMFVVRDFLPPDDCARLIELIDRDRFPSGLLADKPEPGFRTSESCNLDRADPFVASIEDRISKLMGIQPEHGETVQGQRYAPGQQFKPHHDWFHVQESYWQTEQRQGGQRTWTVMVFLNEPEGGGHTNFPNVNVRITPRTGNLLAWNNMDAQGEPNPYTLHEGTPVTAGVKYVITKWYRERPWYIVPEDIVIEGRRDAES
jgi:prolyl 4-hydroxylase